MSSLDTLKYVYMYMSTPQTIGRIGFIFGFANSLTKKEIAYHPLTSIIYGTVHGLLYGFCSLRVKNILPQQIHCIIPIILLFALVYQKCQSGGGDDHQSKSAHKSLFSITVKDQTGTDKFEMRIL